METSGDRGQLRLLRSTSLDRRSWRRRIDRGLGAAHRQRRRGVVPGHASRTDFSLRGPCRFSGENWECPPRERAIGHAVRECPRDVAGVGLAPRVRLMGAEAGHMNLWAVARASAVVLGLVLSSVSESSMSARTLVKSNP